MEKIATKQICHGARSQSTPRAVVFYAYDRTGNILTADYAGEQTETNTYNELGLLTTVTTAEGDTLYQYDGASRLLSVRKHRGRFLVFWQNTRIITTARGANLPAPRFAITLIFSPFFLETYHNDNSLYVKVLKFYLMWINSKKIRCTIVRARLKQP